MSRENQEIAALSSDPIGWYVHLPFCRTKCGYCDFYSLPTIPALIDDLIDAISREIEWRDPYRPVEAVFIGGGTPTELPPDALSRLLRLIEARAGRPEEWTVEANPTSTTELHLDLLCKIGVNRISFGAQSFDPNDLRVLERLHDPRHIGESVTAARTAGFDNVNLDLIFGIPGQTLERWRGTLRRAIDLGTEHLSCYGLMYEDGTALTRLKRDGRLTPCDEDLEADMFHLTIDELETAGFEHYEISNFARDGRRCQSNVIYWENREYLGVGPSAVSYLGGERRKNVADVRKYCEWMSARPEAVGVEVERLSPRERAGETAVQMLRMTSGIDLQRFAMQTGFDARTLFADPIRRMRDAGLLVADAGRIRLTRAGMVVANRVMQEFLLSDDAGGRPISLPILTS